MKKTTNNSINQKRSKHQLETIPTVPDLAPGTKVISKTEFSVVYADPPWNINQTGSYGALQHYNLMTLDRIKAMPINNLTRENAACFLWIPNGLLQEGLDVLKAWGFTYRGPFYWIKAMAGLALGQYFRNCSETLLLGTKGRMPVEFKAQPNWGYFPRQEHSRKPEEVYYIIERLYPNREYLELFARNRVQHKNWWIWGNEAEGGSDVYIPGYPVPEYSGKVKFIPPAGKVISAAPIEEES